MVPVMRKRGFSSSKPSVRRGFGPWKRGDAVNAGTLPTTTNWRQRMIETKALSTTVTDKLRYAWASNIPRHQPLPAATATVEVRRYGAGYRLSEWAALCSSTDVGIGPDEVMSVADPGTLSCRAAAAGPGTAAGSARRSWSSTPCSAIRSPGMPAGPRAGRGTPGGSSIGGSNGSSGDARSRSRLRTRGRRRTRTPRRGPPGASAPQFVGAPPDRLASIVHATRPRHDPQLHMLLEPRVTGHTRLRARRFLYIDQQR